eukprot:1819347-Prymnesium_polylepis.1
MLGPRALAELAYPPGVPRRLPKRQIGVLPRSLKVQRFALRHKSMHHYRYAPRAPHARHRCPPPPPAVLLPGPVVLRNTTRHVVRHAGVRDVVEVVGRRVACPLAIAERARPLRAFVAVVRLKLRARVLHAVCRPPPLELRRVEPARLGLRPVARDILVVVEAHAAARRIRTPARRRGGSNVQPHGLLPQLVLSHGDHRRHGLQPQCRFGARPRPLGALARREPPRIG